MTDVQIILPDDLQGRIFAVQVDHAQMRTDAKSRSSRPSPPSSS